VFYSSDGGTTWLNRSGSLPNVPVHCLAVDGTNNVYAGTDIGIYFRSASQNDWTPFYNGLPNVPVTDLIINTGASKIRAATFGRGIWQSDLFTPCPVAHLVTLFPVTGAALYEATQFVQISVPVIGGANTTLDLRAGDYVQFLPGFEAKTGVEVEGAIGPCSVGIPD